MSDRAKKLERSLQESGFAVAVGIEKLDSKSIHLNIAPRTYHVLADFVVQIDWPNGQPPTKSQHATVDALLKSLDLRSRKPREAEAIIRDITERPAEHVRLINDKIDNAMRAEFLQRHPKFLTDLGMNIPGDEVEE